MLKDNAITYFNNGYSCAESVMQACIDAGICPKELLPCTTTFSGGMSSGCVCGALASSQIVLGYLYGRGNRFGNNVFAREKALRMTEEFKKRNKVTCCRVLCSGLEGAQRKEHCNKMVSDVCEILETLIDSKVKG